MTYNQNYTRVQVPTSTSPGATIRTIQSTYDDIPPNPIGRGLSDNSSIHDILNQNKKPKNKPALNRARKTIQIATLNVRTIRQSHKRQELVHTFGRSRIDILGIQEHRIIHSDTVQYEAFQEGTNLITTSAWRNTQNASCGGIGALLNNMAFRSLAGVTSFTQRILIMNFAGNPATTVIVTYAPTEAADSEIAEEHYKNLLKAIKTVPAHNLLVIIGDFNARISKDEVLFSYHDITNRNGNLLLDLSMQCNLDITNTSFRKKPGKLWTYLSDTSGIKFQLDYILINKKWRNSIKNTEAYNFYSSVGSDHRVLLSTIKLSLRTSKTPPRQKMYEWSVLQHDNDLQHQYSIAVTNRFSSLCMETDTITERYQHLIEANNRAAESLIPTKKRKTHKRNSKDPRVVTAREQVNTSFELYKENTNENNRVNLQNAKFLLEQAYNCVEEEDLNEKLENVITANIAYKHRESWKIINEISGRKKIKKGQMEGKTNLERINNWYKHFSNLLGKAPEVLDENEEIEPILQNLNIRSDPFDLQEYHKVKKAIKENKASGADGIPPEVLKRCDLDKTILSFCNQTLGGHKPDQWSELHIIPLPKSGDLSLGKNYRGITLSSIVAKMFNRLILNRIQPEIDPHLRPNQNGFRPNRTTTSQILALRRIIEGVKARNLQAVITFIDFKKAFDSIHRKKMIKILKAYGIPEKMVDAIAILYNNTRAKILSPDGETEYFEIIAGVLQGDTLAPYLFAIVLDYAMMMALNGNEERLGFQLTRRRSRRTPPTIVTDMDFADDIALISHNIQQAQELLSRVEKGAAKVGLKINADKTKAIYYNQDSDVKLITIDQLSLETVQDFKYLGSYIDNTDKEINVRKAQTWQACNKLMKIWKSKIDNNTKIRLFLTAIEPVLLYGSETWTLTNTMEKRIDGCYTRLLRTALNIHWSQHITNTQLYGNLPPVSNKIKQRRLRLSGHLIRHEEEIANKLVMWEPTTQGRANRGRRKTTYVDQLKRDTGLTQISEMKTVMLDREVWKELYVNAVRVGARPK